MRETSAKAGQPAGDRYKDDPAGNFVRNCHEMLAAARTCIANRQHVAASVLVFALIDSLAWAAYDGGRGTVRANFEQWSNRWLLPELATTCPGLTATDVYAARCGALHTMTSDSDLAEKGLAKRIMYAWGTAPVQLLRDAIAETPDMAGHVAVHYDDLIEGLDRAVQQFVLDTVRDADLRDRVLRAAGKHYAVVPNQ